MSHYFFPKISENTLHMYKLKVKKFQHASINHKKVIKKKPTFCISPVLIFANELFYNFLRGFTFANRVFSVFRRYLKGRNFYGRNFCDFYPYSQNFLPQKIFKMDQSQKFKTAWLIDIFC